MESGLKVQCDTATLSIEVPAFALAVSARMIKLILAKVSLWCRRQAGGSSMAGPT